ncbi:glycosyltransferase family 2 protein [Candidatus Saccharibacteria bacterium]|nr:glycosyltransferase family 2 protein [Candidatus Saccharibacteria bacterium]
MTDIEIPYEKDRKGHYRFFEILPGLLSWTILAVPFILSYFDVRLAAFFVLVYLLINFARAMAGAMRALHGYHAMRSHQVLPWTNMIAELAAGEVHSNAKRPNWHKKVVARLTERPLFVQPDDVLHAVIVATYKEVREVLEPTIQSIIDTEYNMKQVIFVLAYEERAGEATEKLAHQLVREYGASFKHAMAVGHPAGIPGEVVGKGGNVTYAGRELEKYVLGAGIDPKRVLVTTLDADNRPDKQYFNALSYTYMVAPKPLNASYQPVSLYTNNIWDAPAPMRVLATGNSFFNLVISLRSHALRNFSSHAQPLASLMKTDYWSVRTIVEDGHQFWRSYFTYDGDYRVYPLHVPIYQDAVLSDSYIKTLKAQFVQLRRWTYGASDIAYVVDKGFFKRNKVPRFDLIAKTWRLLEGHINWAVGSLLILFGGFIPSLFHPKDIAANELPIVVSRVQTVAVIALLITIFLSLKTLPPKPLRYKRHRSVFMVLQWVYLPITTVVYNSFAAYYSQTRLMLGKYMSKFDVTEKAVVVEDASGGAKRKV